MKIKTIIPLSGGNKPLIVEDEFAEVLTGEVPVKTADGSFIGVDPTEGVGNMLKEVYDQDENGIVDDSEKLGGELPEYYATATSVTYNRALISTLTLTKANDNEVVHLAGNETITGLKTVSALKFDVNYIKTGIESVGTQYYDTDYQTISFVNNDGTISQRDQEIHVYGKNISGTTIANGQPVAITAANGQFTAFDVVDITDASAYGYAGIATQEMLPNAFGKVTKIGKVNDIDTSHLDEGKPVYVGVDGLTTKTYPTCPNLAITVGTCDYKHANHGRINVQSLISQKFQDLSDVNGTPLTTNGQFITYSNDTKCFDFTSYTAITEDNQDFNIITPENKTLVLEQPVWDDIIIPITRTRLPVANFPSWTSFISPMSAYTFAVNDYVEFSFEIPHKYKEGTALDCHIHGATNGLEATDKYINFQLDYTISTNQYNSTTGIGSVFTSSASINHEFKIPANTTDRSGFYFDIGDITGTGFKIGSQVHCKLTRIASVGTAPASNPFISTFGVHIEMDTIGSRQEYSK